MAECRASSLTTHLSSTSPCWHEEAAVFLKTAVEVFFSFFFFNHNNKTYAIANMKDKMITSKPWQRELSGKFLLRRFSLPARYLMYPGKTRCDQGTSWNWPALCLSGTGNQGGADNSWTPAKTRGGCWVKTVRYYWGIVIAKPAYLNINRTMRQIEGMKAARRLSVWH